jgi:hypothetical protein
MPAVPADADALSRLVLSHACAHGIHESRDFVAGHTRILDSRPVTFLGQRIAVANAAGLDFDPDVTGTRLGNVAFNDFKRSAGAGDLGSAHLGHKISGSNPQTEDATESDTILPADKLNFI